TNENLNFIRDDDNDYNVFGASVINSDSKTNDLDPYIAQRDNTIKSISLEYNPPNENEELVVDIETTGSTIKISTDRKIYRE
ncbi:26926_t:CDS:2, partial [Racocetra persica]